MSRLTKGGLIDRSKPVEFTFDGKQYKGFEGDTIASALLANGVRLIGRSWKYHRPRGIIGDGAEEPNALFQVEEGAYTIPNVRGTQAEIYQGMVVKSTNAWPSLNFDLMSVFSIFARFLPAGFYYKTFMWPKSFWMAYEHMIRKASGLGSSPVEKDPDQYEKTNAFCDVLVVGSGATGLMAALTAAEAGARVIVADEQSQFGGRLLSESMQIDGLEPVDWVTHQVAKLEAHEDVLLLTRATVFGYHDANFLTVNQRLTDHLPLQHRTLAREKIWRVRAKQVIIASGAHERPIAFANNDRPGVMLASAVATYLNRYGVNPGRKAVFFTNNDSAYQAALSVHQQGLEIAAIVDCRTDLPATALANAKAAGIEVRARLMAAHDLPENAFEISVIKTTGDAIQSRPLSEIGGKGLFTKELKRRWMRAILDIAVHSMKDVPTRLQDGHRISAVLPREDVRDALVSHGFRAIGDIPRGRCSEPHRCGVGHSFSRCAPIWRWWSFAATYRPG